MRFVIDASIAVKWFIVEDYSDKALKLLKDYGNGVADLYAPCFFKLEVANALRKYFVKGILSKEMVYRIYNLFKNIELNYIIERWDLVDRALKYSINNSITLYDALYIIIAKHVNGKMVTADDKLYRRLKDVEEDIVHIRDYDENV